MRNSAKRNIKTRSYSSKIACRNMISINAEANSINDAHRENVQEILVFLHLFYINSLSKVCLHL